MLATVDKSQIRQWVKVWLKDQRDRTGLSQEKAARRAEVGIGVIRSAEQVGSPPDLLNFLRLVMAYDAEKELVNQIREWRDASRQPEGTASVTTNGTLRATGKIAQHYKEAERDPPKSGKKSRPKHRSA